jgi:transposase
VRIVRRGSGSVVTWLRAQMVPLSAHGMNVAAMAKVVFTSEDRVGDVIRNFNADGFGSLYPKYKGGHPPMLALGQRWEIKKIAKSRPAEYDPRTLTWASGNNVEITYTPTNSSWLNRIEAQFTALRYLALDGTDHASHQQQASVIRRDIIWRNNHSYDERLRHIVILANYVA